MTGYRIIGTVSYEVIAIIEADNAQEAVRAFERGEGGVELSRELIHREINSVKVAA